MPLTGAKRFIFDRFGPKTRYDLPQRHKAATGIVNHIHVLIISSQIFPKDLACAVCDYLISFNNSFGCISFYAHKLSERTVSSILILLLEKTGGFWGLWQCERIGSDHLQRDVPSARGANGTCWDGRNPEPVEVGSLSHYLRGLIHPRWCRISAINSSVYVIESFAEKIAWSHCLIQFHVRMFEIARVMMVLMAAFRSGVAVAEAMTFSHDGWLLYCSWYFIDTCISTSVCNAPVCILFVLRGCILHWKHSIVASSPKRTTRVFFPPKWNFQGYQTLRLPQNVWSLLYRPFLFIMFCFLYLSVFFSGLFFSFGSLVLIFPSLIFLFLCVFFSYLFFS